METLSDMSSLNLIFVIIAVLAVGFGPQGFIQYVVTGLTILFSNIIDGGDMVEISGQNGIVKSEQGLPGYHNKLQERRTLYG